MQKLRFALLAPLLLQAVACLSADRPMRKIKLNSEFIQEQSAHGYRHRAMSSGLQAEASLYIPKKLSMLENFLEKFAVDSEGSAFKHFNDTIAAAYVKINNPTHMPLRFSLRMLTLENLSEKGESISPENLPNEFERTNWNGAVKNVYNASMITLASIAVIAATIYCISEDVCDGLDIVETTMSGIDAAVDVSKQSDAIFSDIIHRTELSYEELLPMQTTIPPGQTIQGLVFFQTLKDMDAAEIKFSAF